MSRIVAIGWLVLLMGFNVAVTFMYEPIEALLSASTFLIPSALMAAALSRAPNPGPGFVSAGKFLSITTITTVLMILFWLGADVEIRFFAAVMNFFNCFIFTIGMFFVRSACRRSTHTQDAH